MRTPISCHDSYRRWMIVLGCVKLLQIGVVLSRWERMSLLGKT